MKKEDYNIDEITNEEGMVLEYFLKTGECVNYTLKQSIDNDRINGEKDGKVVIFPSLNKAAEFISKQVNANKSMVKHRIKKGILSQENKKIYGYKWSENVIDYMKRIK